MKRILVGLDGSERAKGVFDAALELAQKTGAKLILVQAVGVPIELPVEAYKLPPGSLAEVLERDATARLKEFARANPAWVEDVRVVVGTPWQVVCNAAHDLAVDLVVVGSHGYGVFDRLIGTTAARIVNHCDCSVLVARSRPA